MFNPTDSGNSHSGNAHHLEERQISDEAVVEVNFGCEPRVVVERSQNVTVVLRTDDVEAHRVAQLVHAAAEPAAEQVDAHDAEDEPEDETDEQHVEDGWDRLDQCVHHYLHARQLQLKHGFHHNAPHRTASIFPSTKTSRKSP